MRQRTSTANPTDAGMTQIAAAIEPARFLAGAKVNTTALAQLSLSPSLHPSLNQVDKVAESTRLKTWTGSTSAQSIATARAIGLAPFTAGARVSLTANAANTMRETTKVENIGARKAMIALAIELALDTAGARVRLTAQKMIKTRTTAITEVILLASAPIHQSAATKTISFPE